MRVLHVIPSVAPQYGGPSTAIAAMCDALNRIDGITVEVATTDAAGSQGRFDPADWTAKSTRLHLFPRGSSERWKWSKELAAWLDREAGNYQVIHTHAAWSYSTYAACRAGRRARVPIVYRPCGTLSRYTWTRGRLLKWAYWSLMERSNVATAAAFHCTSDEEAIELRDYRAITAPVSVIPLGVDDAAWTTPRQPDRLRTLCQVAPTDPPVILFLSRLHPKKGIADILLPALAQMKMPAILAIAGSVDVSTPNYPTEIRETAAKLGVSDRVRMLGAIPANERWEVLDGADLFVLPSHQENFGIVVAEAMARGVPVVISDQVQIAPQLLAAKCGSVVSLDSTVLASTLDQLLRETKLRSELGRAGQKYARTVFDWNAVAQQIVELYRRLQIAGSKGAV